MNVSVGEGAQYLEESAAKIEKFEGRVHWLYLDTPGLVTVGVGRMLPDVLAAQALPFQSAYGDPVSMEQVAKDFERVSAMEPNHLPTFYLCATSVMLGDPDIDALLFSTVCDVDRMLRQSFIHYTEWPKSAKLATIDMMYNLGRRGFMKYKKMIAALMIEDWSGAAKECDRNIQSAAFADRNYWTRTSFLNAELEVAGPVSIVPQKQKVS